MADETYEEEPKDENYGGDDAQNDGGDDANANDGGDDNNENYAADDGGDGDANADANADYQADPEPEQKEAEPEPEPEPEPQKQDYGNVETPSTIKEAWDDLCSDNNTYTWFSAKLIDTKKMKSSELKMDRAGKGGLNELKDYLEGESSQMVFFLLRVNTYDDSNSVRCKFLYGRYIGTSVGFMSKAKLTPMNGAIADNFPVKHMTKDADENFQGWTPEAISKDFLRIGGAHKPSRYSYGTNAEYQVPKKAGKPSH